MSEPTIHIADRIGTQRCDDGCFIIAVGFEIDGSKHIAELHFQNPRDAIEFCRKATASAREAML